MPPLPSQSPSRRNAPLEIVAALATGGLLTLMLLSNSAMAAHTSPLFSSLTAHGTGSVVAALALLAIRQRRLAGTRPTRRAPLWAYLGGVSGALTVMLTSQAANSSLALTGTLAIGLAGQVVLALAFDCFGALGIQKRLPRRKDLIALGAILAGTLLIIRARGMG
ncbi:DMT family transporter [Paracoccus ravus]|uniref:DMT family transporter n=1 Tax=Paracoccus ravus TaxID=2447760 RepID=UPI00106E4D3E|nr:DMT family transporter [Paracoccus ravus]